MFSLKSNLCSANCNEQKQGEWSVVGEANRTFFSKEV